MRKQDTLKLKTAKFSLRLQLLVREMRYYRAGHNQSIPEILNGLK
jgi:hypothetical protein